MRKLGQHFLKNKSALRLIVEALGIKSGETVIEIGPGHGELTVPLAEICATKGCRLIVVEKDEELVARLGNVKDASFEIKSGDVLKMLPQLAAQAAPNFKLIGNIPYYITGHLLRMIGELEQEPETCVFTIQKEVAERIVAKPLRMNRLAASVQFWAEPKILKILPASDFSPAPKVDSAIIQLMTRGIKKGVEKSVPAEKYYAAVRAIFAQPRKTILNNIEQGTKGEKGEIITVLEKAGINPKIRPQDLAVKDIIAITSLFIFMGISTE